MRVLVDADACPVVRLVEKIAKRHGVPVWLFCDTAHTPTSDYATVRTVDRGRDSVDFCLANFCEAGDVVVTQDYGVAAMVMARGARAVHQNGFEYLPDKIEAMLYQRHMAGKARRASAKHHGKGPSARTKEDDAAFEACFEEILAKALMR